MSEKVIKSYKAFDKNMRCRDFQYEVGREYEMDGDIKCCNRGFHACKNPLEVWDYYDMLNSRFAEVEQSGKIDEEGNSTKVCSSHIKIKAELKLADIIKVGVEWLKDITSPSKFKTDGALNDNGDRRKQIGSSGYSAQIGSSGGYATVCMFTGLKDYENQDIYEGDILAEKRCPEFEVGYINCTFAAAYVGDDKFIFNLTALSEVCTVCGNKFDRKEGEK